MNDPRQPEVTAPHVPAGEPSGDTTRPRDATPAGGPDESTRARSVAPLFPPALVAGPPDERYRFGEELARGGMGVVYRAEDLVLGREVAVKVLAAGLAGTDAARRFIEEARITAGLEHPSIPPIQDLGTLPDGRPFLAMKLIKGQTLAKKIAGRESPTEDLDDFAGVFEKVCEAVAFAHSKGIIHRDLKPANVMVGAFGEVQVMDWGLAKNVREADRAEVLANDPMNGPEDRTRSGQVMGTPAYMPPEQARGELHRVDERSDVFALGGILCAILTGEPPYTGAGGADVLRKAQDADLTGATTRLSATTAELIEVDQAVEAGPLLDLARKCLRPDPNQRPPHASKVLLLVRAARSKIQTYRRSREIDRAVAGVEAATRSAMRYSVAARAGCGVRLFVIILVAFALGFVVYVRSLWR